MIFDQTIGLQKYWEFFSERYNPLRGLDMRRLSRMFDDAEDGRYAEMQLLNRIIGRRDALVRATNRRMRGALNKLTWKIGERPDGDLSPGDQALAKRQADFLRSKYEAVTNIYDGIAHLAGADFKGYSHLEVRDMGAKKSEWVIVPQYHWCRKGRYGVWEYNAKAEIWAQDTVPLNEDLRSQFIIREVEDPAYEIFATAFTRKNFALKDWDGFIENWGIPWIFLVMPPGLSPDQQTEWQSVAERMIGDGRGVLPGGSDVKTADASNRGTSPFVDYLRRHDEDIVLTATGGLLTLLNDGTGLGGSQGKEHGDAWDEIVAGTARDVETCLQRECDARWLEAEFGPGVPAYAWFELARPEQGITPGEATTRVKTLHEAGYEADREWVQENTGVKLAEPAAPVVVPPAPAPAPAGAPVMHREVLERKALEDILTEATADVLDIQAGWLETLRPAYGRILHTLKDASATREDFLAVARDFEKQLPEILHSGSVSTLADSLERAMGEAVTLGAVEAWRKRKQKVK
jgi:phage gp29-like protein